jgi:HD domain
MRALRRLTLQTWAPVAALAAVTVVTSCWLALTRTPSMPGSTAAALIAFFVAIAVGETARLESLTGRESAPMSTASALGFALSPLPVAGGSYLGTAPVLATTTSAILLGALVLRRVGRGAAWSDTAARLLGVSVAPILYRHFEFGGHTLVEWQGTWEHHRWRIAVVMVLVGGATMLLELALGAAVRSGRYQTPLAPMVVDELRASLTLSTALVTSGALIALAEYALGLAALPLFLLPLALTYFAVQRYAGIRTTYRQTIAALSSLTDRAGYTVPEHAQRVATLAVAVGRDLGMGQRDLTDLEYAALLHDLGQVALREPIPAGATVMAAPADQQRIAHDGAEIVRTTGVLDQVAEILEAQTTPYRQVREFGQDLPVSSRIIKVANAYDDMSGPKGENDERAMERIHLGLGYEYDPRVVDSLTRVLERRRRGGASASPA